ncbi:MAG: L-histidine N(alpha)-methyltransferase [Solirubrobacterales bacterium]
MSGEVGRAGISLAERVWEASEHDDVGWSMLVVGEDHVGEMKRLSLNLSNHEPDPGGDGRFIDCGHAYWGVGPTISWHRACQDPSYLVGRRSAESFAPRWKDLCGEGLNALPSTYVSLGPGTGEKDIVILESMEREQQEPCYIPVDMSAEMLRLHLEAHGEADESLRHMIAVKLDFSLPSNVEALREFLDQVVGKDEPILFSLVGNTLANFTDDEAMLRSLVDGLLTHENDLLLLELATADKIDEAAAKKVEMEYRGSSPFLTWVTSALTTHTDLAVDLEAVKFLPSVEEERALVLKVVYKNTSPNPIQITLVDGTRFSFQPEDTIRLELTRKYHPKAVADLLAQASLSVRGRHRTTLSGRQRTAALSKRLGIGGFGMELLLAARDSNAQPSADPAHVPFRIFNQADS